MSLLLILLILHRQDRQSFRTHAPPRGDAQFREDVDRAARYRRRDFARSSHIAILQRAGGQTRGQVSEHVGIDATAARLYAHALDVASGSATWGEILGEGDEIVARYGQAM